MASEQLVTHSLLGAFGRIKKKIWVVVASATSFCNSGSQRRSYFTSAKPHLYKLTKEQPFRFTGFRPPLLVQYFRIILREGVHSNSSSRSIRYTVHLLSHRSALQAYTASVSGFERHGAIHTTENPR